MLRVVRVVGSSMAPTLRDGDFVLALGGLWSRGPRPGDVVLVEHPELGLIVKRVLARLASGALRLVGDGVSSSPTESLGDVSSSALRGRVLLCIAPPPRGIHRLTRRACAGA